MIPLGLDLSVTSTGWAVWGGDVGRIRTDVLPASRLGKGYERRRYIADAIEAVVAAAVRPAWLTPPVPVAVVMEAVPTKGAFDIVTTAMLHGVVLDVLGPLEVPVASVPASTLKKHLAGNGRAEKPQMIAAARAVGYEGDQHDEADAVGLALIGHHLLGGEEHLTPMRAACLSSVRWLVPLPETAGAA